MDDRINILLVDDEPRNLDALEAILEQPEYHLVRAQSADEALLALLHRDFAAIVLDIRMPGVSGLELAGLIKSRRRTQHTPILFLTAHLADEKDIVRGYGVGAVDYLQKPITPAVLRSKVAVFVDLFRKTRALAAANQALAAEVTQRQRAQEELRQANEALEQRVRERTVNLTLANQALSESQERFRVMADTVPDITFTQLRSGQCDYLSGRFYEYTGMAPSSGEGFGWSAAFHQDDLTALRGRWLATLRSGDILNVEHRLRNAAGEHRWFRSSIRPIRDQRGRVVRWFGSCSDIHDLKAVQAELSRHHARLEEQVAERSQALMLSQRRLVQQDRLAAIGTLATGLGHDMSNLLLPVRARLDSLSQGRLSGEAVADVTAIREAAAYLQRLASALRLLAVDPDRASERESVTDLASWWQDVSGLLRAGVPRGVVVTGACAPGLPAVAMSASRLTQIIFNLVQNAGEAISTILPQDGVQPRGTVSIHAAARSAVPRGDAGRDTSVLITVTDDGPGMSPEVAARCFEPYYSTKVRAVSTGMGLSMVRAWVDAAGGTVRLQTSQGQGSTFLLTLPATSRHAAASAAAATGKCRLAVTLEDARLAGFVEALGDEGGLVIAPCDGELAPEADVWIVGGAAAAAERLVAFIGGGRHRRAVVFAEAPTTRPRGLVQPPDQPERVWFIGRHPTFGELRAALQRCRLAPVLPAASPGAVVVRSPQQPEHMEVRQA
jgi:PAS domain S-box-containing protein